MYKCIYTYLVYTCLRTGDVCLPADEYLTPICTRTRTRTHLDNGDVCLPAADDYLSLVHLRSKSSHI